MAKIARYKLKDGGLYDAENDAVGPNESMISKTHWQKLGTDKETKTKLKIKTDKRKK